jgi:hypothetical protein
VKKTKSSAGSSNGDSKAAASSVRCVCARARGEASVRAAQLAKIHEVVLAPVIPCSVKTNEGIGELLRMVLADPK